jgi:hypothetical protein
VFGRDLGLVNRLDVPLCLADDGLNVVFVVDDLRVLVHHFPLHHRRVFDDDRFLRGARHQVRPSRGALVMMMMMVQAGLVDHHLAVGDRVLGGDDCSVDRLDAPLGLVDDGLHVVLAVHDLGVLHDDLLLHDGRVLVHDHGLADFFNVDSRQVRHEEKKKKRRKKR